MLHATAARCSVHETREGIAVLRYILKRILQFIPVFLGVTLILFIMQNVVPGDPII